MSTAIDTQRTIGAAPDETVPPVLSLRGLTVDFASGKSTVPAVRGIDLDLVEGEFVAIVGESGSGKTTLGTAAIGLLPPTAHVGGSIRLDGLELNGQGERVWNTVRGRQVAFVAQDPGSSLNPVKTIGSQVAEIFKLGARGQAATRADVRRRCIELLASVGIDRPELRLKQYPHELSGGMKQRVLLAIAFGLKPRLLIADEPTSALDVTVQKQVLEVFDALVADSGSTVLFITHDLAVASDHASRIVVMRQGLVVEEGSTEKIVLDPAEDYTRRLLAEAGLEPVARDAAAGARAGAAAGLRAAGASIVPDAAPAVRVSGLVKEFGSGDSAFRAVDSVSFAVPVGSTFAVVGESGSGKSTTARLLMGLLTPTAGQVEIDGRDTIGYTPRQKRELWRSIQLVYQNPDSALDPRSTVRDTIGEPLRSYRVGTRAERRARVDELLDQVALPRELGDRRPRELSGGQRQRVAIARALALNAGIIILDEALSALDVLTQASTIELLKRLQREHRLTYIFISHDLEIVRRFADHVAVLRRGVLVETGPIESVFTSPQSEYTRALLSAIPGQRLAGLRGGPTA